MYINTGQEFDGSDSGARPDEAVSWGKIRAGAESVKVRLEFAHLWADRSVQTVDVESVRLALVLCAGIRGCDLGIPTGRRRDFRKGALDGTKVDGVTVRPYPFVAIDTLALPRASPPIIHTLRYAGILIHLCETRSCPDMISTEHLARNKTYHFSAMRMDSAMNGPLLAVDNPTFLNPKRYGLSEAIAAILLIGRIIHFVGTCCLDKVTEVLRDVQQRFSSRFATLEAALGETRPCRNDVFIERQIM